jgi:hypothetical protein
MARTKVPDPVWESANPRQAVAWFDLAGKNKLLDLLGNLTGQFFVALYWGI